MKIVFYKIILLCYYYNSIRQKSLNNTHYVFHKFQPKGTTYQGILRRQNIEQETPLFVPPSVMQCPSGYLKEFTVRQSGVCGSFLLDPRRWRTCGKPRTPLPCLPTPLLACVSVCVLLSLLRPHANRSHTRD